MRSRVALLKDHLTFGVDELRVRLRHLLCDRSIEVDDRAVKEIEQIEQDYYDPTYLYGQSALSDVCREARIEGCGTLALHFALRGTLIERVTLAGDFFELGLAQETFNQTFAGKAFTPECLQQALLEHHPERTIRNLTTEALAKLLGTEA